MIDAHHITATIQAGLRRRYRREARFRAYGIAAVAFSGIMLLILLMTILRPGISGFFRHEIRLSIPTSEMVEVLATSDAELDFYTATNDAVIAMQSAPMTDKASRHALLSLLGNFAAADIERAVRAQPSQWGQTMEIWVPLADTVDQLLKGRIDRALPEMQRPLNDRQLAWLDRWQEEGRLRMSLNRDFFTRGDSRAPEAAGFMGAIVGSLLTLVVCMAVALPISLMAAITLEEFAGKSRVAEALEVIINNLAAVPSIIYGLLGLSIYLQWFEMPRSASLVGGLTLAMLIMPVMIIASRAAIRAVPPSMRQAATALGATPLQVVRHHVLPYALPGILTGTILSVCRALGETAPLLMIGMVAFVADIPRSPMDPATVMPVQVFLWASSPELGFIEKTSSAILVLLAILLLLNYVAIRLRNRSQLTWN
jgi:phosphate transport system permease protein